MPGFLPLNDGTHLPALGLGLYKVAPGECAATITSAVGLGYRLLDGASFYGNERAVGEAIRALEQDRGIPREDLLVASKFWGEPVQSYDQAMADFEATESALDIGPLDLYYIHWPRPSQDNYVDTWRALVDLQAQGRVHTIAVCNFNAEELTRLIEETGVVPAINQVESHPWLPQHELRAFHARYGILTQAWSPLGRGRMLAVPAIRGIAAKHGCTPAQVVLAWHLALGGAAIPKSTRAERQRENLAADSVFLDADDMARLAALENGTHTGTSPDERR